MQYLGVSQLVSPGSIMSYIGTIDPEGWIICDGVLRTATDNRYSVLAGLLGGTGNSITPPDLRDRFLRGNSTTSILTKAGSATITLTNANMPEHNHIIDISDNGHSHDISVPRTSTHTHNATITNPTDDNIHYHSHGLTVVAHSHISYMKKQYRSNYNNSPGEQPPGDDILSDDAGYDMTTNDASLGIEITNKSGTAVISSATVVNASPTATITNGMNSTSITATSQNAGSATPTSFSMLPPYTTINYIIKY